MEKDWLYWFVLAISTGCALITLIISYKKENDSKFRNAILLIGGTGVICGLASSLQEHHAADVAQNKADSFQKIIGFKQDETIRNLKTASKKLAQQSESTIALLDSVENSGRVINSLNLKSIRIQTAVQNTARRVVGKMDFLADKSLDIITGGNKYPEFSIAVLGKDRFTLQAKNHFNGVIPNVETKFYDYDNLINCKRVVVGSKVVLNRSCLNASTVFGETVNFEALGGRLYDECERLITKRNSIGRIEITIKTHSKLYKQDLLYKIVGSSIESASRIYEIKDNRLVLVKDIPGKENLRNIIWKEFFPLPDEMGVLDF